MRKDIIELVRQWGLHEYFDSYRGGGYGTANFSRTAARFIDIVRKVLQEK